MSTETNTEEEAWKSEFILDEHNEKARDEIKRIQKLPSWLRSTIITVVKCPKNIMLEL